MHRSEELGELAKALAAAQAEMGAVPKGADNSFFGSKYAELADVVRIGAPVLSKHGLAVSQFPSFDETGDVLITWLMHSSGQFMVSTMRLKVGKPDMQGLGSAITYGRRQSYMGAVGMVADKDDDGNQNREETKDKSETKKPPQPTAKPPEQTRPAATPKQRGMINGRAADAGLSAQDFANAVRHVAGIPAAEYATDEDAMRYVNSQLDRLPADRVDDVLAAIGPAKQTAMETSA